MARRGHCSNCSHTCPAAVPAVVLRPWALRLLSVATILCPVPAVAETAKCTLVSLILRYEDSSIDLEPPFDPEHSEYRVRLDWSFKAFSVDARPDTGCEVHGVPLEPKEVAIGGREEVILFARQPETGANRQYVVTAYRMLGSEIELRRLAVEGGEMSPDFDERHREYTVVLALANDVARIVYGLSDNEQRITGSAHEERPISQARDGSAGYVASPDRAHGNHSRNASAVARRLLRLQPLAPRRLDLLDLGIASTSFAKSGEAQFRTASMDFLLDVGFSRSVELTVQCADPTQASIGMYTLHLTRPGCKAERPFFHPEKKVCVNFCSSGYYRNHETHRCSHCNENCKICGGLLDCQMCTPDTSDFTYVVQPDGKCRAVANHLFRKYRWWCVGLGVLLLFLLTLGCCGIVQFCCAGDGSKRSQGFTRVYDSDTDEDIPGKRYVAPAPGRLARY